jgi:hypothetical protein
VAPSPSHGLAAAPHLENKKTSFLNKSVSKLKQKNAFALGCIGQSVHSWTLVPFL